VVSIQDILAAMPSSIPRPVRLATTDIPLFLRDELNGRKTAQVRLSDGRRVCLWILRGSIPTREPADKIARAYEAEAWLHANRDRPPLSRRVVSIQDILAAMPSSIPRPVRLATTDIPLFLRDELDGRKTAQVRLSDGRRVYLWILRGSIPTREPAYKIARAYEAEQ
jgi:hypothetical protein